MRIEGFVLAPPPRGLETLQLRIGLQAMGLKDLRLELDCSGTEDRARSEVSVDRCALSGPELGETDLSLRLVGSGRGLLAGGRRRRHALPCCAPRPG